MSNAAVTLMVFFQRRVWRSFAFYAAVIAASYGAIRLSLGYGLDDTSNIRAVRDALGEGTTLAQFLGLVFGHFIPSSNIHTIYRPLRTTMTFIEYYAFPTPSGVPILINVVILYLLAWSGMKLMYLNTGSRRITILSALFFFTMTPVIAMGQVVLVSQFLVLLLMILPVYFWQEFFARQKLHLLIWAVLPMLAAPYYAEASVMTPLVALLWVLLEYRARVLQPIVALGMLVLVGLVVLSLSPQWPFHLVAQASGGNQVERIGAIRGYDIAHWQGFASEMVSRARPDIVVHLLFLTSPIMVVSILVAKLLKLWSRKKLPIIVAALVGIDVTLLFGLIPILWAVYLLFLFHHLRHQPLLVAWCLVGSVALTFAYVIEIHLTYFLWPLACLLLISLEHHIPSPWGRRWWTLGAAGFLVLVIAADQALNVYNTRAAMAATLDLDAAIAQHLRRSVSYGRILTNGREGMDWDFYSNAEYFAHQGGPGGERRFSYYFTESINPAQEIHGYVSFEQWLSGSTVARIPTFMISVIHQYASNYAHHENPFRGQISCASERASTWSIRTPLYFLDPLKLALIPVEHGHMSQDFFLFPGYPDTIDDIGVRTEPFRRWLNAEFEVEHLACEEPLRLVATCYKGYALIQWRGEFYALPKPGGPFSVEAAGAGRYVHGTSIAQVKGNISLLSSSRSRFATPQSQVSRSEPELHLVEEGFHSYNIVSMNSHFYGVRQQDGAFTLDKLCSGALVDSVEGTTIEQVKRKINDLVPTSPISTKEG